MAAYRVEIETACSHSELSQLPNVSENLPGRIAPFSFDPEIFPRSHRARTAAFSGHVNLIYSRHIIVLNIRIAPDIRYTGMTGHPHITEINSR